MKWTLKHIVINQQSGCGRAVAERLSCDWCLRARMRQFSVVLLMTTVTLAVNGCGYLIGPSHDLAITSVEVPTFKNETWRRGIEQMLTESVQKEIQQRTTMRLVRGPGAQTRLTGRIIGIRKSLLGRTMNDDARELQLALQVEVTWTDLRTGTVLHQDTVDLDASTVPLDTQVAFAPEIGHSQATASQDVIQLTARRIVDLMDSPW